MRYGEDLPGRGFLKGAQAKLERETNISMDGHPGRELRMRVYGGAASLRLFLISGRLYQLAITLIDKKATSEEETIEKFFKSFKPATPSKSIALRR